MPLTPPRNDLPPRPVDRYPGIALLLAMALGLGGVAATDEARRSPDASIWDGSWGVAWEKGLDDGIFFHDFATEAWGVGEYLAFGDGRAGVVVGEDGWLYTSEEFALPADAAGQAARKARLVFVVKQVLAANDVDLHLALLPAKARVEAAHLGAAVVPAEVGALRDDFVAELAKADVPLIDLEPSLAALGDRAFLRTDTHWSPEGADAAAQAIAAVVKATGPDWVGGASVIATATTTQVHRGDLLRYLPLGPFADRIGPAPDELVTQNWRVESGAGLLDDATIPVALVGTSYSDDPRWGFLGALQNRLSADVLNAATQGKGPFTAMLAYLDSDAWNQSRPRAVIWEIPERYLGTTDEYSSFSVYTTHRALIDPAAPGGQGTAGRAITEATE